MERADCTEQNLRIDSWGSLGNLRWRKARNDIFSTNMEGELLSMLLLYKRKHESIDYSLKKEIFSINILQSNIQSKLTMFDVNKLVVVVYVYNNE